MIRTQTAGTAAATESWRDLWNGSWGIADWISCQISTRSWGCNVSVKRSRSASRKIKNIQERSKHSWIFFAFLEALLELFTETLRPQDLVENGHEIQSGRYSCHDDIIDNRTACSYARKQSLAASWPLKNWKTGICIWAALTFWLVVDIFLNVFDLRSQPKIEQPLAARDLWLAVRVSSCSWAASGRLRHLTGPKEPAR